MGSAKRENWQCMTCRQGDFRCGPGDSQEGSVFSDCSQAALDEVNSKLSAIQTSFEKLLTLQAKVDELLSLRPTMIDIKSQVGELQDSVEFCSSRYDTLLEMITGNNEKAEKFGGDLTVVKWVVDEQSRTILALQSDLYDVQQFKSRSSLEIQGLLSSKKENLPKIVNDLAAKL